VLPGDDDLGGLGVARLARMWARTAAIRAGLALPTSDVNDPERDRVVINGLGLGLEPTVAQLWRQSDSLASFESWILAQKGGRLEPGRVRRVNALILNEPYDQQTSDWLRSIDAAAPVLNDTDLKAWNDNGYVVVRDALSRAECQAAERAVWDYLASSPSDPDTWYSPRLNGIMVQLFQHSALDVARQSPRIHKAFAQLWGTSDLLATTDRCGFNPPERDGWRYPGPHLHWDISLEPPVRFDVQGILYLTDTAPNQGAFICVPGFQHQLDEWLTADPDRQHQRAGSLHIPAPTPIPGRAGDLVIWHGSLPHASSPNHATRPRIVQYLTMAPPFPG
jgi:Phytanoyl-CoA dioxygenase (PhyH)